MQCYFSGPKPLGPLLARDISYFEWPYPRRKLNQINSYRYQAI